MQKLLLTFNIILFFYSVNNAQSGMWTWMHGSNLPNPTGSYGTQGVASATNVPPELYEGCEWTDLNGNFWYYGGTPFNAGSVSTLWKFDPVINMWTWVQGPNTVNNPTVHGTMGVPAATNSPGPREYGACTWVDLQGNLWLFGGAGIASDMYSDLWKYSISTNMWTWMNGPNTPFPPNSYGVQGVSSALNYPPPRTETNATWVDNMGNLWLLGGYDQNLQYFNDLWKYNISINQWTWMRGANTLNSPANYGTIGIASPTNDPPGNGMFYGKWKDKNGDFWFMGGDPFGASSPNSWNELWKYNVVSNQWTCVKQSNLNGGNPTACSPNLINQPEGRSESRTCWVDSCGKFWLFGGYSSSKLNDLWCYNPTTNEWTFVNGNVPESFGVQNIPALSNQPPSLEGAVPYHHNDGSLWFFGGKGSLGNYNSMWRYVIDTNCVGGCAPQSILTVITTNTNPLCNGACTGTATATPTGTAPYTYSWNTTPIQITQTATGLCAGNYTVTLTDATNTTATSVVTITQPAALTANITNTTPSACTANTGAATVSVVGGTSTYTYSWSPNGGTAATASNLAPGTYTVNTTDANGCTQTATATIAQQSTLTTSATSTASSCASNTGTATVTAASGTPGYTYNWLPTGGTGATTGSLAPGTYTITVADANGCTSTSTVVVATIPGPTAIVSANATIQLGNSTVLTAGGGVTYNWIPSNGLSCSNCANSTANPTQTTTYCVEVKDNNACKDTACVTVTIETPCPTNENLQVPNAFSPNADGVNDDFCLQGWNNCVDKFSVTIFDRWGEKVYESRNPDFCWDGTNKGKPMEAQVFVYYIKSKFTNQDKAIIKKGNISLIR